MVKKERDIESICKSGFGGARAKERSSVLTDRLILWMTVRSVTNEDERLSRKMVGRKG